MGSFRKVGLVTCTALALANMIGTGVFTSLGFQVAAIPSPFLILLLWVLGGVIALCGALSYAELAAALPRSGGEYNFLSQIYHPAIGFMAGFVSVAVGFSAPIALSAIALGKYLAAALPGLPAGPVSIAAVLLLAAVHSLTVRASGNFQVLITALKVTLIVAFILIGIARGGAWTFSPHRGDAGLILSGPFAVSLMFVLYSYSGWNAAAYIIEEVRDAQRSVPGALILATIVVMILYVALNVVFLASGPMGEFAGKIEVGEIAARNLLGEQGGRIMAALIGGGLISAISAMTWAGPRVAQTVGRDFSALRILARTSSGRGSSGRHGRSDRSGAVNACDLHVRGGAPVCAIFHSGMQLPSGARCDHLAQAPAGSTEAVPLLWVSGDSHNISCSESLCHDLHRT